jgi:hypothetical protein
MNAIKALEQSSCAHYLTPYLQGILDAEELMRACDRLAGRAKWLLRRVLNNAHVQTADEDCVAGWEQGLGLTPGDDDTLEQRRAAIIERLSHPVVANESYVMGLIDTLFGGVQHQASMDCDTLSLTITTEGDAVVNGPDGTLLAQTVADAIRPVVPMNVRIDNIMRAQADINLAWGGVAVASIQTSTKVINP